MLSYAIVAFLAVGGCPESSDVEAMQQEETLENEIVFELEETSEVEADEIALDDSLLNTEEPEETAAQE